MVLLRELVLYLCVSYFQNGLLIHGGSIHRPKRQLTVSLQGLTVGFIKHEAAAQTAVRNKSTTPPGRDKGGGYAAIVALKYMDA